MNVSETKLQSMLLKMTAAAGYSEWVKLLRDGNRNLSCNKKKFKLLVDKPIPVTRFLASGYIKPGCTRIHDLPVAALAIIVQFLQY